MSIRNLDRVFRPRRIAVVGASDRPGAVGGAVLRNLFAGGFEGVVYPVNPGRESVQGVHAYPDLAALPRVPDLAIVCTPAATAPGLVRTCGELGVGGVLVISGGFREAGGEGRSLETQLGEELRPFEGMRLVGPNCVGVMASGSKLNASFGAGMPKPGGVAFISQSGALCTSVLDWALAHDAGFSYFISAGNMLDVGFGDLIDYVAQDPATNSIILYVESISDPRSFLSAARAFARNKPVVVYKAGRFAESAAAAKSHTGAMAGEDAVYDAAFRRVGIRRVDELDDMFECAGLLTRQAPPEGERLAVLTNAGGPGVISSDAVLASGGTLALLGDHTIAALDAVLPPSWPRANPVDLIGDAPPQRYAEAARIVLADEGVDAMLAILAPQAMIDPAAAARAVVDAARGSDKPVLACWMGGAATRAGHDLLIREGVPTYRTPEAAVHAFMHLVEYKRNLAVLHETPRDVPAAAPASSPTEDELLAEAARGGRTMLPEHLAKRLLASYGIAVATTEPAASAERAVELADQIGYPVVLKILSDDISHKSDVGGVVLDLPDAESVRAAFDVIMRRARSMRPDASVQGVTVQKMHSARGGFEMIIGAKRDATFGPVLMVGAGGTAAEVFEDRAIELPPLNEALARRMLSSLKSWPLLTGFRGAAAMDVDGLIDALIRLGALVADHPQIVELDANPVLCGPSGVIALDARVAIDPSIERDPRHPHGHMAISPYPERSAVSRELPDGTPVRLRPIRPEDEPLWRDMLAECSAETLRGVFGPIPAPLSHWAAARACTIDYDRELAIVAELEEGGTRRLVGCGRLIADPDHESAEYTLLVPEPWRGRGIGRTLATYALEVARAWSLQRVTAHATTQASRMLESLRTEGFKLSGPTEDGELIAVRDPA